MGTLFLKIVFFISFGVLGYDFLLEGSFFCGTMSFFVVLYLILSNVGQIERMYDDTSHYNGYEYNGSKRADNSWETYYNNPSPTKHFSYMPKNSSAKHAVDPLKKLKLSSNIVSIEGKGEVKYISTYQYGKKKPLAPIKKTAVSAIPKQTEVVKKELISYYNEGLIDNSLLSKIYDGIEYVLLSDNGIDPRMKYVLLESIVLVDIYAKTVSIYVDYHLLELGNVDRKLLKEPIVKSRIRSILNDFTYSVQFKEYKVSTLLNHYLDKNRKS
jgi:hypothetical protein